MSHLIGLGSNCHLLTLIVKPFYKHINILTEIHALLPELPFHNLSVAAGHLHFAATSAPVKQWHFKSELHHLIVLQWRIGTTQHIRRSGEPHPCVKRDLAAVTASFGNLIVGLKLTTTDILGKLIICQSLVKSIGIRYRNIGHFGRKHRLKLHITVNVEK